MRRALYAALFLAAALALVAGWRHFWFLTDDAFIEFRYVSNSRLGFGYVWNAPPFRPVEGYTSFLWMVILDGVWRFFGVEPPRAANPLSLVFAFGTLALTLLMMLRLPLRPALACWRPLLIFFALALILGNRTFLAWTSSGLETALFNFLFTAWVAAVFFERPFAISTSAALLALARPDGLLAVAASLLLGLRRPRALLPLAAVPIHVLWRHFKYGEWLPNTYYAKHVAAWPESGRMYLACFVLEYALWIWLAVLALALLRRESDTPYPRTRSWLAAGVLFAHFWYYTFEIGGDHFEYRVYSHLIPFIGITFLWALNRLHAGPILSSTLLTVALAASLPMQWLHWRETHWLPPLSSTWRLRKPIAPLLPESVRFYGEWFDERQKWLIEHYVCMRHQEHRNFFDSRVAGYAPRTIGERTSGAGNPIFRAAAAGYVGWVMPHVAILDGYGLNDWVIARNPVAEKRERTMAHDRAAPPGYLECFKPNVAIVKDRVIVQPRPLSDGEIRACEHKFAAALMGKIVVTR